MARIRTIKPEFFTSEDIVSLTPFARLLYIALWCESDKEGRLQWKPKTFKLRYFPADNVDINALCAEILDLGLVVEYDEGLAYIPQFAKHQHVNPRESASTLPVPPGTSPSGPRKVGKTVREAVFERDGHACVRCGSTDKLQVDHILPQSAGGPHIIENLRTLCKTCHAARPVSGEGLERDLASDGFTIQSLRVKLGIDASILDIDAQVGREGKGREGVDDASNSNASNTQRNASPLAQPDDSAESEVASLHTEHNDADAPPEQPRNEVRGTRLPDDWTLPKAWGDWALQEQPGWTADHVRRTAEQFRDFWIAKPGKDGRKVSWEATWRNWVRREAPTPRRPASVSAMPDIFAGMDR